MKIKEVRKLLKSWGVKEAPIRPPWAFLEDPIFTDNCKACGECIAACPEGVIVSDPLGFPEMDFMRGQCTFCGACARACKHNILTIDYIYDFGPWYIKPAFAKDCLARQGVNCRICADHCEKNAIRICRDRSGWNAPLVTGGDCTGCGACVAPCPVSAIRMAETSSRRSD